MDRASIPDISPAVLMPIRKTALKYQIFPGNNSNLVKRVFTEGNKQRALIWIETQNLTQSHFHFRWAPTSKQINFDRLSHNFVQTVNHFEGHIELTRKHDLFKNIKHYMEHKQMEYSIFKFMPL
jgi:hypothetical protein